MNTIDKMKVTNLRILNILNVFVGNNYFSLFPRTNIRYTIDAPRNKKEKINKITPKPFSIPSKLFTRL